MLFAGSKFPVATRWKEPFALNLAQFLNASALLRDVVDTASPACFDIAGLNDTTTSTGMFGLQMQPGCVERARGLQDQGYRVEPVVSCGAANCTIDVMRQRLGDTRFVQSCADAMAALNASGLVFDVELEASNASDGAAFAVFLTQVRGEMRKRRADARVVVATGTGRMGKTDVLASSAADIFVSMGTYFQLKSFDSGIKNDVANVGAGRYSCGLCDSCALQVHNNSVADIDARFERLAADAVQHVAWWLLEYSPPAAAGPALNASLHHEYWWSKIREWKRAAS